MGIFYKNTNLLIVSKCISYNVINKIYFVKINNLTVI